MRSSDTQAHSASRPISQDDYSLLPSSRTTEPVWPVHGVYNEPIVASGRLPDATSSRELRNIMGQGASTRREEPLPSDAARGLQMNQERHTGYADDEPPSSMTFGERPQAENLDRRGVNGANETGREVLDDPGDWNTEGEGLREAEENTLYDPLQGSLRDSSADDVEMLDAPPPSSSSRTPSRASSYFSRFSSRWPPRSASPYNEDSDDGIRQGRIRRRRLSNSVTSSPHTRESQISLSRRFGTLGPSSNGNSPNTLSRRRRNLGSISRPIPQPSQEWSSQDDIGSPRSRWPQPIEPTASGAGPPMYHSSFPQRASRLSRLRDTLPMPFPNIFSSSSSSRPSTSNSQSPARPQRPSRSGLAESSESFVPQLPLPDFALDDGGGLVRPPFLSPNSGLENNRTNETSSEPTSSRSDRDMRRLPDILRRRNTTRGRPGEDQAAMLTRLLSVAAAATAASLIGHRDRNILNAQDSSIDGPDGSFEGFLQDIRNGRLTSALRNGSNEPGSGPSSPSTDGTIAPFNFIRMFRFDTSSQSGDQGNGSSSTPGNPRLNDEETFNGPMVPVIIVGIRSVSPGNVTGGDDGSNTPPFIEALSNLTPTPTATQRGNTSGGLLRRPEGRTIFGHRRRASMGGLSTFPANYDSQRHQRSPELGRSRTEATPLETPAVPSLVSDTPPGPRPPPSTPLGLSTNSSGNTTPSHRPSSASAGYSQHFSRRSTALDSGVQDSQAQSSTARQRRRSDSEFARHGDLGAGASRRNGVVEPDSRTSDGPRSWIIYVLGGSYPEDHPILTTPSLFTDNPSYEDMLLLSSLLGPVKPPVASQADVAAASGTYQVSGDAATGALTAVNASNNESFPICSGERCLVCLGDYILSEELRKLTGCGHFFHRECIDQWLTTGRNSCPLCRGKGVDESSKRAGDNTADGSVPPVGS